MIRCMITIVFVTVITQLQMRTIEKKFNEYDSIISKQSELNEVQLRLNNQLMQRIVKLTGGEDER